MFMLKVGQVIISAFKIGQKKMITFFLLKNTFSFYSPQVAIASCNLHSLHTTLSWDSKTLWSTVRSERFRLLRWQITHCGHKLSAIIKHSFLFKYTFCFGLIHFLFNQWKWLCVCGTHVHLALHFVTVKCNLFNNSIIFLISSHCDTFLRIMGLTSVAHGKNKIK